MRPGIPGRRRGDRSADGGLKDLAKLAMTISGTVNWAKELFFFRFGWRRWVAEGQQNGEKR